MAETTVPNPNQGNDSGEDKALQSRLKAENEAKLKFGIDHSALPVYTGEGGEKVAPPAFPDQQGNGRFETMEGGAFWVLHGGEYKLTNSEGKVIGRFDRSKKVAAKKA